jgi:hypothetical protein
MCGFETVLPALARLGADPMSGVHLNPGADETSIHHMQDVARRELGEPLPDAYTALLRLSNGVQVNNALFKAAEHVVPENVDAFRPEVIVLGSSGNIVEFVFDRRDRRFHTINMGFPDERPATFGTLEELLLAVLREQQVL